MVEEPIDTAMQLIRHPSRRFHRTIIDRLVSFRLPKSRNHLLLKVSLCGRRIGAPCKDKRLYTLNCFRQIHPSSLSLSGSRPCCERGIALQTITFGTHRCKIRPRIRRSYAFTGNDMVHLTGFECNHRTAIETLSVLPLHQLPTGANPIHVPAPPFLRDAVVSLYPFDIHSAWLWRFHSPSCFYEPPQPKTYHHEHVQSARMKECPTASRN